MKKKGRKPSKKFLKVYDRLKTVALDGGKVLIHEFCYELDLPEKIAKIFAYKARRMLQRENLFLCRIWGQTKNGRKWLMGYNYNKSNPWENQGDLAIDEARAKAVVVSLYERIGGAIEQKCLPPERLDQLKQLQKSQAELRANSLLEETKRLLPGKSKEKND